MTRAHLYRLLCLWAYRRWSRVGAPESQKPVGVPGNRDPQHPCTAYAPRPARSGDWGDCLTDGHYLCAECAHRAPPSVLAHRTDITVDNRDPVRHCERVDLDCYANECRDICFMESLPRDVLASIERRAKGAAVAP